MPPATPDRRPFWLLLYTALLPLRRLEFLPVLEYLGPVIHLTEVVFLFCAPMLIWRVNLQLLPKVEAFVLGTLALLLVLTYSTLRAGHSHSYFELLGRYYLIGVFVCFYWATRKVGPAFLEEVFRWWRFGAWGLIILAYLGYPLAFLGWEGLVWVYYDYPYFGTVYRASAAAGGATALMLVTWLPWLYDYWRYRKTGERPWFFLICLPLYVLTLSKEVLVAIIILLAMERVFTRARLWHYVTAGVLFVAYNFSTHYLIQGRQDISNTIFATAEYSPGKIAYRMGNIQLLETTYVSLKRTALWQAARHPVFGIGADQFQQQLQDERPTEVYPVHLPPYGPHCTWLGTSAEAGYTGLMALLIMVHGLFRKLHTNLRSGPQRALPYNQCLTVLWLGLAVASINGDFLHLQYIWVPLALVMGQVGPKWERIEL